jgi:hypothetical protein
VKYRTQEQSGWGRWAANWSVSESGTTGRNFTYTGDIRVPVVHGQKVLDKGGHDGNLLLSVVVHDLKGQLRGVGCSAIVVDLFSDKTVVVGEQSALSNGSVVRSPLAVKLHGVTGDSVTGVVGNGVVVLGLSAVVALGRIAHIVRVAERTIVYRVLDAFVGLAAQKVVDGAVLHAEKDNILDLLSQVDNGGLRTWQKRGRAGCGAGEGRGGNGKSQHAKESTLMHFEQLSGGQRAEAQIEESRMLLLGEGINSERDARSSYTFSLLPLKAMMALPQLY